MRLLVELVAEQLYQVPSLLRLCLKAIGVHFNKLQLNGNSAGTTKRLAGLPEELCLWSIKEIEAGMYNHHYLEGD